MVKKITYGGGPVLKSTKNITRSDIIKLCELLNELPIYKDICKFNIEPILEGGIIFKFLSPDASQWYKTIRLNFRENNNGNWPFIKDGDYELWKASDEILLLNGTKIETFLKSFYGAPAFTTEEIKKIVEQFIKIGFVKSR